MKTTQLHKELHNVALKREKQNESGETRIDEILIAYSIWFMKNNIEEFQMFCKFWNEQFIINCLLFIRHIISTENERQYLLQEINPLLS